MEARNRILEPREVEGLIADGQVLVIYEGCVLRLNSWLDKHPGGRLAILHMVGRDATDEINVYHFDTTLRSMKAYRIGRVRSPWINFVPPLQGGVFRSQSDIATDAASSAPSDNDQQSTWSDESVILSSRPSSVYSHEADADIPEKQADSLCPSRCQTARNRRISGSGALRTPSLSPSDAAKPPCPKGAFPLKHISRESYAAALEQQNILENIRSYPALDSETQRAIVAEYRALHEQIQKEGFYQCRYSEYGKEALRWTALFTVFLYLLRIEWYLTSAVFLGLFWQQIMFTAHDAGHRGITGNFIADTLIGAFVADFCCGLSIGWWKSSHNVHHLVTNMPEHDPDIQNIPLFATSPKFFNSIYSTFYDFTFVWDRVADFLVPYQKITYYPVMAIARFNLYLLSWLHLLSERSTHLGSAWWTRHVEIVMMLGYWFLFGYCLLLNTLPNWPVRVGFVLVSHTITMILHVQITLSHWGMPTSDLGPTESFPQRQLRTTMDVDCPPWMDFLHGGLQFQVIHHLFPRVPRHNLRAVQAKVREFCEKMDLKYQCYGFVKGNQVVLSKLEEVANMVDMMVKCQTHMAETGESGLA